MNTESKKQKRTETLNNKPIIDAVVVVEGKTDTAKLKQIFNVETIETNGSAFSEKTINLIKKVALTKKIILFLDPDFSGNNIRKKIEKELDKYEIVNIPYVKKINNKKNGVAEADTQTIINAFSKIKKINRKNKSISWDEYLELNLSSKNSRLNICNHLNIDYCNNKQLFLKFNQLNLNFKQLQKIIKKIETNSSK